MGLVKLYNCGYTEHELTYYDVLVEVASTTDISNGDKIELWDVEPYESDGKQPKWTWYIEFETDKLLYPLIVSFNTSSANGVILTNHCFDKYGSTITSVLSE